MSLIAKSALLAERLPLPDSITEWGISRLVGARRRILQGADAAEHDFALAMDRRAIAEFTADANAQHYEVPAAFFDIVLGPRKKYSSCLYPTDRTTLAEAEEFALAETCQRADLHDGQAILELGCGWGSLSLWMAEHYPAARITSVSNSHSQRAWIMAQAHARGLTNLTVLTADMNDFATDGRFDRVVSVEMFEHMSNWRALLTRVRSWLAPGGLVFLHVFSHRSQPYRFDHADKEDWIAQHFFTGGVMPSHTLIRQFADILEVEAEWQWNGIHYARTARDWLARMDADPAAVAAVLRPVYGRDLALWTRRWRLFFMATAGLFGHAGGHEWGISHWRLRAA
jgi:cyclopropane-fatty-acyl-phospholipid synthase